MSSSKLVAITLAIVSRCARGFESVARANRGRAVAFAGARLCRIVLSTAMTVPKIRRASCRLPHHGLRPATHQILFTILYTMLYTPFYRVRLIDEALGIPHRYWREQCPAIVEQCRSGR